MEGGLSSSRPNIRVLDLYTSVRLRDEFLLGHYLDLVSISYDRCRMAARRAL